jgi:ketosteroid isomerase-like protein
MSEQDNVQVVQKYFQLLLDGDAASLMPLLAQDVVLVSPGPKELVPWAGEYHGPQGVIQYYTALVQGVELTGAELQGLIVQGDRVAVVGRHHGRIRATGKSYDLSWVAIWTFREGKIASMHLYHDTYLVAQAARPD